MSKHFISSTLNNNLIHCTDETDLNTALTVGNVGKIYELNNTVYEVDTGGSSFVNKPYKDDVGSGAYRFKRYDESLPDFLHFKALTFTSIKWYFEKESDTQGEGSTVMTTTPELYYSTDAENWSPYTINTIISLSKGQVIYWKGDNVFFSEKKTYTPSGSSSEVTYYLNTTFYSSASVAAGGNIMSIFDSTMASTSFNIVTDKYPCRGMFAGCTKLTTPPRLPATSLTPYCYYKMFSNCTSLRLMPKLPATTLQTYCYGMMFNGCTSLTYACSLSSTGIVDGCYQSMFAGCTSLSTLCALPGTSLGVSCYQSMYSGCSLIKLSDTQTGEYVNAYRIPTSGTGTTGSKSLASMFYNTGGTFTGAPSINTTYYTSNNII